MEVALVEIISDSRTSYRTIVQHTINITTNIHDSPCLGYIHNLRKKSTIHSIVHPPYHDKTLGALLQILFSHSQSFIPKMDI